jgi:Uma2 family endonuclease
MTIAQHMTLEAFLDLPEEEPALEFADGTVTQKVSPKLRHSVLQGVFIMQFNLSAQPNRLGQAFPEIRTTYAGRSTVPDVSFYVWDRIPEDANGEVPDDGIFEPPDIAVEIVSPEQSVREQAAKCRWYVANGVRLALLVDPRARSVTAFRLGIQPVELRGDDRIDLSEVLPDFQLSVQELFAALRVRR